MYCFFAVLICLFAYGCSREDTPAGSGQAEVRDDGNRDEAQDISGQTEVTDDNVPASPVITDTPSVTPDPVITHEKMNPRITLEIRPNDVYLACTESKTVQILKAEAVYNDYDLAFPTILVTIEATVYKAEDSEAAVPVEYSIWAGLPPFEEAHGIISLGAGYSAGEKFSYVMEIDGLAPGYGYVLEFLDGREAINALSEEARSVLLAEGQLVTLSPDIPDPELTGRYSDSFVVSEVSPLSLSFGNKYDAISFVFRDADGHPTAAPATADIRFVGDSGVTYYESSVTLTKDNFRELRHEYSFDDPGLEGADIVGKILIPAGNLLNFDEDCAGTLYVTFYNEGVFPPVECSCSCTYRPLPASDNEGFVYDEINWPESEPGVVY